MLTALKKSTPSILLKDRYPFSPPASHLTQRLKQVCVEEKNEGAKNSELVIRPVQSREEMDEVYRITYESYLERGYCSPQKDKRLIHYPQLDCLHETTTLVAVEDGEITGTQSLTIDGPFGLHVDEDFKIECDQVRQEGRKIAASWRIATKSGSRNERALVMALIQKTVDLCFEHQVETSLFTFNPRHERIYKRLLNMQTLAHRDKTHGLSNAPSVFMRWDHETCPERWLKKTTV